MKLNFSIWLVTISFTIFLFACADHRLGGALSPVRLRLKTVQGGTVNTNYTYDGQNRLASITKATGNRLSSYFYDDVKQTARVNQYTDPANLTTGFAILFPYNFTGLGSFVTRTYGLLNATTVGTFVVSSEAYAFDATNHLSLVTRGYGNVGEYPSSSRFSSYTTTGENLTKGTFAQGRTVDGSIVYEYDTNLNPYFGLNDPDLTDTQRFSRNNILKETSSGITLGNQETVYEYEYNVQNLPIKRTKKQSGSVIEVLTYSYDSY